MIYFVVNALYVCRSNCLLLLLVLFVVVFYFFKCEHNIIQLIRRPGLIYNFSIHVYSKVKIYL